MSTLKVWTRNPNRQRQELLTPHSLKWTAVLNGVGTWEMTVDGNDEAVQSLDDGWGIIVYDDGVFQFSGDIGPQVTRMKGNTLTVDLAGTTDMEVLRNRQVLPDPTKAENAQSTAAYWTKKGTAEALMVDVVNRNAGPQAIASRRTTGLSLATSRGRGASTSINARNSVLLDELVTLATVGNLIFDVRQVKGSPELELSINQPVDRRREVRFFPGAGLGSYEIERTPPKATTVIVAGGGEGTARVFYSQSLPPEKMWGLKRIELFQDRRDTTDPVELAKAATETLAENEGKEAISFELSEVRPVSVEDDDSRIFGVDFNIGDIVTVAVNPEIKIINKITSAEVVWNEFKRNVKLGVGEPMPGSLLDDPVIREIKAIKRDLKNVETRK